MPSEVNEPGSEHPSGSAAAAALPRIVRRSRHGFSDSRLSPRPFATPPGAGGPAACAMRLQTRRLLAGTALAPSRRYEPPRDRPGRLHELRPSRGRAHGGRRVRALSAREGRRLDHPDARRRVRRGGPLALRDRGATRCAARGRLVRARLRRRARPRRLRGDDSRGGGDAAGARSGEPRSEDIVGSVRPMARIATWRRQWFGLAQEALPHPARGWRGAGLGSSPHGPPAPRRLPVPRGGREMWPAGIEPRLRGVVAERLGVGPEDLQPDVSLTDDLAADSLDLIDVGLALEAECGVVLRRRALESVRTYGDLLVAVAAARRRAARRARVAPIVARARIVPARGNGGLERSGELTPYEIEILVADALRAGPGARLEMELSASTDDAGLAATRKRFAWLAGRGVAVSVQRDHRAA